jgi:hypothetical protein
MYNVPLRPFYSVSANFFENLHFGDFLSAPSFFLKRRRRMRGMKVGVVGDDA